MRGNPMTNQNQPSRPRNIANDILDAVETATNKWTRQKKSEERHPGMIRYRMSRMTKQPRTSQKEAAWQVMEAAYMATSANNTLPALARQIFYQARPKIMALTDDKELAYGYFSQTLLPDYIEEHGVDWNVVYDARGHFEEPHTHRRIGVGTIEIGNYLHAMADPEIICAKFAEANVEVIGPDGNLAGVLFCEKEGFGPLFRAVNLANRYDLMIISTKGVYEICGENDLPLFTLHDFDFDGFKILGTLHRDTRRYVFTNTIKPIDLGLRIADIAGLEREPAAATKVSEDIRRALLTENGATAVEIDILLRERVELNALPSDALINMIERKLKASGIKKVVPDKALLAEAYEAFHHSKELREIFEKAEKNFKASKVVVPKDLKKQVRKILEKHGDLRWDDALQLVLKTRLNDVRAKKQKAKNKSGDFTNDAEDDK
jgi:hypothetical protein